MCEVVAVPEVAGRDAGGSTIILEVHNAREILEVGRFSQGERPADIFTPHV